jgi:hypothetical protein
MESEETNHHKRERQPSNIDLNFLYEFIDHLKELLDDLNSKNNVLPKVDKMGRSDCPFAERLYADKEEALGKVVNELKKIKEFIERMDFEIKRCEKNLGLIRFDRDGLSLDEARKQYDAARERQKKEQNVFIYQKQRLNDLLTKGNKLLKTARDKRHTWPLGKPKKKDNFNPEAILDAVLESKSNGGRNRSPGGPVFNKELNSLVNLGPLG